MRDNSCKWLIICYIFSNQKFFKKINMSKEPEQVDVRQEDLAVSELCARFIGAESEAAAWRAKLAGKLMKHLNPRIGGDFQLAAQDFSGTRFELEGEFLLVHGLAFSLYEAFRSAGVPTFQRSEASMTISIPLCDLEQRSPLLDADAGSGAVGELRKVVKANVPFEPQNGC